jgi:hypothetical protein
MNLMKLISTAAGIASLIAVSTLSYAQQSSLPACVGSYTTNWDNCVGTYTAPNGNKYVGEWRGGERTGQGVFTMPEGDKYVGGFRNGDFHGQGSATISNGEKYVGEVRDNKMTGQGTYTWPDGGKYVGEFRDNKKNGQGTFTWPNGDRYVGEYKDDKRTGWGVYTYADRRQLVGEWFDGKVNGLGVFYDAQKQPVSTGRFQDNNLVESMRLDPVRFAYVSQPSVAALKPAPTTPPAAVKTDEQKRAADIKSRQSQVERKKINEAF